VGPRLSGGRFGRAEAYGPATGWPAPLGASRAAHPDASPLTSTPRRRARSAAALAAAPGGGVGAVLRLSGVKELRAGGDYWVVRASTTLDVLAEPPGPEAPADNARAAPPASGRGLWVAAAAPPPPLPRQRAAQSSQGGRPQPGLPADFESQAAPACPRPPAAAPLPAAAELAARPEERRQEQGAPATPAAGGLHCEEAASPIDSQATIRYH
jgi:hypothetical protein